MRRKKDFPFWVLVIIFFLSSFVVKRVERKKSITSSVNLGSFPKKINGWQAKDIKLDKRTYEILGTKDVLLKEYRNKNQDRVILAIVYSGTRRESFHPPEICYLGGGNRLLQKKKEEIKLGKESLKVNKLVLEGKYGIIKVWYWFLAGDKFTDDYYLQQWQLAWNALYGKRMGGALIRVSIQADSSEKEERAKSFIKEVIPYLKKKLVAN